MKIRNNSRAFLLNKNKEILLQKFEFSFTGIRKILWVTPGGGVKDNESFEQALERELFEELGISIEVKTDSVLTLDIPFNGRNGEFISHEVYYLIYLPDDIPLSFDNMENNEKNTFHGLKWWSLEELKMTTEEFEPREGILNILADA